MGVGWEGFLSASSNSDVPLTVTIPCSRNARAPGGSGDGLHMLSSMGTAIGANNYSVASREKEKAAMKAQRDRFLFRWRLINFFGLTQAHFRIKLLVAACLLISVLALTRNAANLMGWQLSGNQLPAPLSRQRYTVLINTFKRNDLLKQTVAHYSSCRYVDAIRVVWSEQEPPPDSLRTSLHNSVISSATKHAYRPDLRFDINEDDDLNNRFRPIHDLRTDAVFSIDDDVVIPCQTMDHAFSTWLSASETMVGFVPRMHWLLARKHGPPVYCYGGWWSVWWTGTYSMVLTKAAFFHKKYLDMYTNEMPAAIRAFTKTERNCEDIAMSFLVANATGASPIWVKGKVLEIGSTGISSLQGHSEHRTECVNKFVSEFGHMPLVETSVKAVDAAHEWFW